MALRLRRKSDGLVIDWEITSLKTGHSLSDDDTYKKLSEEMRRDYEVVEKVDPTSKKILVPEGGWENLTLDNFEEKMGYRFRIENEQSMRSISREVAFLEFLESKGVKRHTKLIEGLTLENYSQKTGQRFRMAKEDKARGWSRERSFQEWLKRNGY